MAEVKKNLTGTVKDDTLIAEVGNLRIRGGNGNDMMYASSTTESFHGGNGDDTAFSYAGNDEFFGGQGLDTFVTKGSTLDYSVSQDGKFDGTANNKWNIVNNETDSVSALKDVEHIQFDNYDLYLDGRNNAPYAEDVSVNALEDTELSEGLTDYVWDLEGGLTFNTPSATTATGGSVTISADGSYTYTPYENYSGLDSFEFTVTDGVNAPITKTVTVDIEAVADTPTISVAIEEGDTVNQANLVIDAALTDTDGSETLQVVLSGVDAGVNLTNATQSGTDWIVTNPANDVMMTWGKESVMDFDFSVAAIATETSNGDSATLSVEKDIDYAAPLKQTVNHTYEVSNVSMWKDGDAVVLADNYFLGVEDTEGNVQYKFGFHSDLDLNSGSVSADLNYDIDFTTYHNYTTDVVSIDSDYTYNSGEFNTTSPYGLYELGVDAYAYLNYALPWDIGTITESADLGWEIISITPTEETGVSFPQGSAEIAWPVVITSATSTSSEINASGEDDIVLLTNVDLDYLLSKVTKVPTSVSGGFDFKVVGTGAKGSWSLVLVDLNLDKMSVSLEQDFTLSSNGVTGNIEAENGAVLGTMGEELLLSDASSYDFNGDGSLDFSASLSPDASFNNKTGLGFDIDLDIKALEVSASGEVCVAYVCAGDSFSDGPLYNDTYTYDDSIGLYDETILLGFTETTIDFVAA